MIKYLITLCLCIASISLHAGYQASPTSTITGTNSHGDSLSTLRLSVISISTSSNNVTFRVEKRDGETFSTSGSIHIKLSCSGSNCTHVDTKNIAIGERFKDFTIYMPSWVTGTDTGRFYARYQAVTGFWSTVGPIQVWAPSLSTPSSTSTTSITETSARINWGSVTGANTYRYHLTDESTFQTTSDGRTCTNCVAQGTTSATNRSISNLDPGTTYRWRVRAGNSASGQGSNWSFTRTFSTASARPTVEVTSPNGGGFRAGNLVTIRWLSSQQNRYKVELFNGVSEVGDLVSLRTSTSARSFSWRIPSVLNNTPLDGSNYRIQVTVINASNQAERDKSNTFAISPVTVSPAGGVYSRGDNVTVNWSMGTPSSGRVIISMKQASYTGSSTGSRYQVLETSTPNDGSQPITIPTSISGGGVLEPDTDWHFWVKDASHQQVVGMGGAFTVREDPDPSVSLTSPNSGDLVVGNRLNIRWSSTHQQHYLLELYKGGEDSQHKIGTIFEADSTSARAYTWTVPGRILDSNNHWHEINGSDYKIKIAVHNASGVWEGDYSSGWLRHRAFDIQPNSGGFLLGSDMTFTWDSQIPSGNPIKISIKRDTYTGTDTGPNFYEVTQTTPNDEEHSHTLPATGLNPGTDWRVWIKDTTNEDVYAKASGTFSLQEPTLDINLSHPHGGSFRVGETLNIQWTSQLQDQYLVELYKGGLASHQVVGQIVPRTHGGIQSLNWKIPTEINSLTNVAHTISGNDYYIKVTAWQNGSSNEVDDGSNAPLTLNPFVMSPMSGNFTIGDTVPLSWSSGLPANTGIKISLKQDSHVGDEESTSYRVLLDPTSNDEQENITIPDAISPDSDWRIWIRDANDPNTFVRSGTLTINPGGPHYTNVSEWAQAAAHFLVENDIVMDPGDGDLRGVSDAARAGIATMIYRALAGGAAQADGLFENWYGAMPDSPFTDVADPTTWYFKPAVFLSLLHHGDATSVFNRDPAVFRPGRTLSRAWAVKAVLEAWDQQPLSGTGGQPSFPDVPSHHPARGYIYKAAELGLITTGQNFEPDEPIDREALFVILHRLLDPDANPTGIVPNPTPLSPGDFAKPETGQCLGELLEQPHLAGPKEPVLSLDANEPTPTETEGVGAVFSAVLNADLTGLDEDTWTDADGVDHQASPRFEWCVDSGDISDETPAGQLPLSRVRWTSPVDFSATGDGPHQFNIHLKAGDGLGHVIQKKHTFSISRPVPQSDEPQLVFDPPPNDLIIGEVVQFTGHAHDTGSEDAPDFGMVDVMLFYRFQGDEEWLVINAAVLESNGDWSLDWTLPSGGDNIQIKAEAMNVRGNKTAEERTITPAGIFKIEGLVIDSDGSPVVNAQVILEPLGRSTLSDDEGRFGFSNQRDVDLNTSTTYSLRITTESYTVDDTGLTLSTQEPNLFREIRIDTAPPTTIPSPEGGAFSDPIEVSLACSDDLSTCSGTFYTIDGSEPTQASIPYSGPIPIDSDTTLRFFSVDGRGNAEPYQEMLYQFGNQSSVCDLDGSGGIDIEDVRLLVEQLLEGNLSSDCNGDSVTNVADIIHLFNQVHPLDNNANTQTSLLDIDASGGRDSLLSDGIMAALWASFIRDPQSFSNGLIDPNADRSNPETIVAYLEVIAPVLDIDGNGDTNTLSDIMILWLYQSFTRGDDLVEGLIDDGAVRTDAASVEAWLDQLTDQNLSP